MRITVIIIVLISILAIYVKSVISSVIFNYKIDGVGLGNLTLATLEKKTSFVQVKLLFIVKFAGLFNIKISNLNIQAYYKGILIGKTAEFADNKKQIVLINNFENRINQVFDISINSSLIEVIYKINNKVPFSIDYNLSLKILGLTINYKGKYDNN